MATCIDCKREMTVAASCSVRTILLTDGLVYELPPYKPSRRAKDRTQRCGDCGVRPGGFHHLGCDMMSCPRCRGQLISCGCWTDGDALDDPNW